MRFLGRLDVALFHPLYNVAEHFFDIGADAFEFHPNSGTGCVGDLSPDFERFVKTLQSKGQYNFVAHEQRSLGFDEQSIGADIFYMTGKNPVIGGIIDGNPARFADTGSLFFY
jgi:hypothetical protein